MRLTARTQNLYASPIAEAHAYLLERAGSRPLLDLSQAAPGYPTASSVQKRIAEVAGEPDGGRYAPPPGLPSLKLAFADELSEDHRSPISPANVLPTAGCNQAFCIVTSALTEPGDEVILIVPYYFNHDMWLKLDGVTPRYLATSGEDPPDIGEAQKLIGPKTRAIVLVTPGNPTGVTVEPGVIHDLFALAVEHDIVLIVDETYRNFRPTNEPSHQLYGEEKWQDNLVTLHSFSKDLAIPGYRVGAVVASPNLLYEAMKIMDCIQICAPRISQEAAVAGLVNARAWRDQQRERIADVHSLFKSVMASEPRGFKLAASGAFFGWVEHGSGEPSIEVVRRLVLQHDVLVIPGTAFTPTDQSMLRFSFANLNSDEITELGARLDEFNR